MKTFVEILKEKNLDSTIAREARDFLGFFLAVLRGKIAQNGLFWRIQIRKKWTLGRAGFWAGFWLEPFSKHFPTFYCTNRQGSLNGVQKHHFRGGRATIFSKNRGIEKKITIRFSKIYHYSILKLINYSFLALNRMELNRMSTLASCHPGSGRILWKNNPPLLGRWGFRHDILLKPP